MGRPQKYDWEDKRDICWKLYNDDKLSGSQIVQYFVKHFGVAAADLPSPNQFMRRFQLWGFPPRRPFYSPEQEAKLLARLRELWNQNMQLQDIQTKVNEEGWELDNYHFKVLRKKYGLVRRSEAGYRPYKSYAKRKRTEDGDLAGEDEEDGKVDAAPEAQSPVPQRAGPPPLAPEEAARRAQRLADMQIESEQLLQARKRRRRIRGFGPIGPDAPGMEPRFNSETSLDECKAYLLLSNDLYVQIRNEFEAICKEGGFTKMSECADGQWQASKDRLVRENVHLSSVLHPLQSDLDKKEIALNCICSDVTKKIRSMKNYMTMADANNILGLDPLQSKEVRRQYYDILEADHFTTVAACGKDHLEQLKQQWCAQDEHLSRIVAENDPQKMRAINMLDRDTRKRFGDDKSADRNDQQRQKRIYGPGPGPAKGTHRLRAGPLVSASPDTIVANAGPPTVKQTSSSTRANPKRRLLHPVGPAWNGHDVPEFHPTTIADMVPPINFDIDPALDPLSRPRTGPMWPPTASGDNGDREADPIPLLPNGGGFVNHPQVACSIPAYFRLSPGSTLIGHHPRLWLGKLASPSFAALKQAAVSKAGAANVSKVHGIVKNIDESEDSYLIEGDEELAVYLEAAGEKATFSVVLEGGYA